MYQPTYIITRLWVVELSVAIPTSDPDCFVSRYITDT